MEKPDSVNQPIIAALSPAQTISTSVSTHLMPINAIPQKTLLEVMAYSTQNAPLMILVTLANQTQIAQKVVIAIGGVTIPLTTTLRVNVIPLLNSMEVIAQPHVVTQ